MRVPDNLALIKIDVEGSEYKVIDGMRKLLLALKKRAKTMPVIMVEFGWGSRHPEYAEEIDAFTFLESLGYKCDADFRNVQRTVDMVFLPPGDDKAAWDVEETSGRDKSSSSESGKASFALDKASSAIDKASDIGKDIDEIEQLVDSRLSIDKSSKASVDHNAQHPL